GAVVGAKRRQHVHRDAGEARRQREGGRRDGRGLHVDHHGIHETLVQEALQRLEAAAQTYRPRFARVPRLHGATRLAARMVCQDDGRHPAPPLSGASACTISAARSRTPRALSYEIVRLAPLEVALGEPPVLVRVPDQKKTWRAARRPPEDDTAGAGLARSPGLVALHVTAIADCALRIADWSR